MKTLRRINLVQFYLFENEQMDMAGATAVLGANGSGKSTLLDAVQTVMLGAHGQYLKFNAQSSSNTSTRTLKGYCLGVLRNKSHASDVVESMAREHSMTYLALGFCDDKTGEVFTAGLCMSASVEQTKHTIHGRFVLPGLMLSKDDFIEQSPEGERPLSWGDFSARVSRRCRDASRTAIIKDKAEAYIGELLAQLGPPTARIDQRAYMRAFAKSMQLRDIESVDEYVRKHIVSLDKIDVSGFGIQIKQFESFKELIEKTKANIKQLEGVREHYHQARNSLTREMSLYSLAANYDYEASVQRVMGLQDDLTATQASAEDIARDAEKTASEIERLDGQLDDINEEINADPGLKSYGSLSKQATDIKEALKAAETQLWNQISPLIQGLTHLEARGKLAEDQLVLLRQVKLTLHDAKDDLSSADATALTHAVVDASGLLRTCIKQLKMAANTASRERVTAENELKDYQGVLRSLLQGQLPLSESANRASNLLADAGIDASPVSYLLKVSDPEWQPAIEAYLAGQLEDFVVADGQENQAVGLIRDLPRREAIYNVKVAQPRHLERFRDQQPASDEVARLVTSTNWVAQAFARRALAHVRFAETEADLGRSERALTKDGMISSGGGTSRKRLPEPGQLRIGRVSNADQLQKARIEHERLEGIYQKAQNEDDRLQELVGRITTYSDEQSQELVQRGLSELQRSRARQDSLKSRLESSESEAGQALLAHQRETKESLVKARDHDKKLAGALGVNVEKIKRLNNEIKDRQEGQGKLHKISVDAAADPYCDDAVVDKYKQQIDEHASDESQRGERSRELAVRASKFKNSSIDKARFALREYEQSANLSLSVQLNDWEQGNAWVVDELDNLQSSNLTCYEESADKALANAHDAFRRDIAYKLHEQMEQMKTRLHDLNNLLDRCPPFSQGERYRFKYQSRKTHSKLREFIVRVSTAGDESQLAFEQPQTEPEIKEAMEELTAMATNPDVMDGRAPSVLTDYREFFTFDLAIRVNNEEVDTLANRTGSGSGGEHRTPFYVIAGASLASTYRLDDRPGDGGGLMLLDEAFYSMDHQNALAAARFLSHLGLQLIMAAPEADMAKITSFSNTIFDIGRDGLCPWLECVVLKEKANLLLTSDVPSEHPDLIEQTMADQQAV